MNNVLNGHSERRSQLNTKLTQRNIQKLKIVSNGLSSTTEESLTILELKMSLKRGNSFQQTRVKTLTIMYMTWIQNWTLMLRQLSRALDMVKIGMAIIIRIDSPANSTLMENSPVKVDTAATAAMAAMAATVATTLMADTAVMVAKVANLMKMKRNLISLAIAPMVTILMEAVVTFPIHMEEVSHMVAREAMAAMVANMAIPITTMVTNTLTTCKVETGGTI